MNPNTYAFIVVLALGALIVGFTLVKAGMLNRHLGDSRAVFSWGEKFRLEVSAVQLVIVLGFVCMAAGVYLWLSGEQVMIEGLKEENKGLHDALGEFKHYELTYVANFGQEDIGDLSELKLEVSIAEPREVSFQVFKKASITPAANGVLIKIWDAPIHDTLQIRVFNKDKQWNSIPLPVTQAYMIFSKAGPRH